MMFTEKAMKAAEEKFSRLLEKAGEKNTSCRYKRGKRARGHKFL